MAIHQMHVVFEGVSLAVALRKMVSLGGLQFHVVDQNKAQLRNYKLEIEVDVVDCLVLIAEVQEQKMDLLACYSCEEVDLYMEAY